MRRMDIDRNRIRENGCLLDAQSRGGPARRDGAGARGHEVADKAVEGNVAFYAANWTAVGRRGTD